MKEERVRFSGRATVENDQTNPILVALNEVKARDYRRNTVAQTVEQLLRKQKGSN